MSHDPRTRPVKPERVFGPETRAAVDPSLKVPANIQRRPLRLPPMERIKR